jgi:hypothetical protein
MNVVPAVMTAIRNKPPIKSQRIGPPCADVLTPMEAPASVIARSDGGKVVDWLVNSQALTYVAEVETPLVIAVKGA